jgi:hypothetical protein
MQRVSFLKSYLIKLASASALKDKSRVDVGPRMDSGVSRIYARKKRFGIPFNSQRAIFELGLRLDSCEAEKFRYHLSVAGVADE